MKLLGLQIANRFSPEAQVFAGLLRQRNGAYDAHVLCEDIPSDDGEPASRFEEISCTDTSRIDFGWRSSVGRRRSYAERLASQARFRMMLPQALRIAREYDPDVIYSSQQKWDARAATYIATRLRKPQVVHLHYTVGPWLGREVLRTLARCDHVVAVSNYIRDDAVRHGLDPRRVTALRNSIEVSPEGNQFGGAEVRVELGVPPDVPLAGIVARISDDKGHADAIAAMEQAAKDAPESRLLIVGEGPCRGEIEIVAAAPGVAGRVTFTGRRRDVQRILAALDVFIHPSRRDPCPLAVLEAQAAGLPVVAYADGGIPELVADGDTGLLAPTGDRVALGKALTALLSDRRLAQAMGRAARERIASDFRPGVAAAKFAGILSQIAREKAVV